MRALIIEDNVKQANYTRQGLNENCFITDVAYDGEQGLYLATQYHYDIIVLDVMLPKMNGWALVQKLKILHPEQPILFLTACDSVMDRVKGLELGADDYLIKPFAFSELLARLRSLLRRNDTTVQKVIHVADLTIDILKQSVTRAGLRISLSAKEFMLLWLLAKRQGEVLSRTLIAEQVWDINFECDTNVIDVAIKRLRDKVDQGFTDKLIHAVRGVGYVLEIR